MSARPIKLAVVTATRAEYGLLSRLISRLQADVNFECLLFVTGAHLVAEQGMTITEIQRNGHRIAAEIPIISPLSDERTAVAGSHADLEMALTSGCAMTEFAKAFDEHRPEAVLVLGDRYELLGICSAAVLMRVPIVHLHGGEMTEGAVDEIIRHAITKMAALHFVAAEPYRQRVIQMGENPERVFNVGAAGLDVMNHLSFLSRDHLEQDLNITLKSPVLLVTYHPVTRGTVDGQAGLQAIFAALEALGDATVIWTNANTDSGGQVLNEMIQAWSKQTSLKVRMVASLGIQRYLSLMQLCDAVVGNSSSGLIEAPAMGVPTVNIGDRQKGRLRAASVLDCEEEASAIEMALRQALSEEFQQLAANKPSVYGHGQTAEMIQARLYDFFRETQTDLSVKQFYDLTIR